MPTGYHGKIAGFMTQDSSTTWRNVSQYCDSVSFSQEGDTVEVTAFNATGNVKSYVVGLKGASISLGGPWHPTMDGYLYNIVAVDKDFKYFPASTDATDTQFVNFSGSYIINSYNIDSSADGLVTWSAEGVVTSVVTRTTST